MSERISDGWLAKYQTLNKYVYNALRKGKTKKHKNVLNIMKIIIMINNNNRKEPRKTKRWRWNEAEKQGKNHV